MYVDIMYDPNAECPRFEQFLPEVFEGKVEVIDYVHRAVGYSLTGDTSEQCLFPCWGKGSNGKSVFLKTIRLVTGGHGHNTPFSTLDYQSRNAIPSDVADLAGKRLVTASETAESTRLNEDRIKALTGGDPVTARHLYGRWFTFEAEFKLWLAVNHKPRVQDDSHGFWRRVRLIPFTRRFSAKEIDKHLDAKLAAEAPGILAWAVRGCLKWQREGLEPPEVITRATAEYREEQDPLAEFIRMRCDVGEGLVARAGELYGAYYTWAMVSLISPVEMLTSTRFGTLMGERFHGDRDVKGKFYEGVALRAGEVTTFSL
jgi:putative DNA primase/helicase